MPTPKPKDHSWLRQSLQGLWNRGVEPRNTGEAPPTGEAIANDNEREPQWVKITQAFCSALDVVGLNGDQPRPGESYSDYLERSYDGRESHFSPRELLGTYGVEPLPAYWPRLSLLRWILDECRDDNPIRVAGTWRPAEFNQQRGGAPNSSHIWCCAVDFDVDSLYERDRILKNVLHPLFNSPVNFGLGLGVGARRIHVDFFSPKYWETGRPRWWAYKSAPDYRGPRRG